MKSFGFPVVARVRIFLASVLLVAQASAQTDPLPSWNVQA
jgi:hypothetical protein